VLYRRCSPQHHHHVVCRSCGREHGFDDVSHTLEISGTCTACRAAQGQAAG
jgi:Fur family ferric uptake transcriptional regulator